MYGADVPKPVFINLEYIFFLFYRSIHGFIDYIASGALWNDARIIATIVVILLITVILYCLVRLYEIKKAQEKAKAAAIAPAVTTGPTEAGSLPVALKNETWEGIRRRLLLEDQNEWRLGIIEADILLDRTLSQKGYQGETLSDKLKQIAPEKMPSLQMAWEAHKVRNRIAHDGPDYVLTQPEARRVLAYYEATFKDLGIIE